VAATITIQSVAVVATGFGFSSFSSAVADVETAMESVFLTTTDVAVVMTTTVAAGYGFLSFLQSLADAATTAAAKYCLRVRGFYTPEFEHIL
jgi:hypothetical protein